MLAVIRETLNRRLELYAVLTLHPLLNEGAHDDSGTIELIGVPVEALVLV